MRRVPILLATVSLLLGCATIARQGSLPAREIYPILPESLPPDLAGSLAMEGATLRGSSGDSSLDADRGRLNVIRLRYFRDEESPLYSRDLTSQRRLLTALKETERSWPEKLPRLCLALSGGGLRSAAVSIGVLQELAALSPGALRGIDIISGVSGGSYAATWPLAQIHYEQDKRPTAKLSIDDVVSDEKPYVDAVDSRSPRFANGPSIITTIFGIIWAEPFLVWQSLLPGYPSVDIGGIGYYVDINNVFHSPPTTGNWLRIARTPLRDTAALVQDHMSPLVILETTAIPAARLCNRAFDPSAALAEHAFEITPQRIGSDKIGYSTAFRDNTFWELTGAVMASGAALDEAEWGTCRSLRVFGLLTGVEIRDFIGSTVVAPAESDGAGRSVTKIQTLRFIDGAATDNLALYPLIKRGCETIIAVDATEDPKLTFKHFAELKSNLKKQLDIDMDVPSIDAVHRLSADPNLAQCYAGDADANADEFRCPVMRGSIGPIPYEDKALTIDLIYVKLSMNRAVALTAGQNEYSDEVVEYYKSHNIHTCIAGRTKKGSTKAELLCRFPQPTSKRQAYSTAMFRALRKLGRDLVRDEINVNGVGRAIDN